MLGKSIEEWREIDGFNTANEISQQPKLWKQVLEIYGSNLEKIEKFLNEKFYNKDVQVILTGAGTSAYVGEFIAPYLRKNTTANIIDIPTTNLVSNPLMYLNKEKSTILINFARSGNSPESVASVKLANELVDDISHIFITCNKYGKLAEISKNSDNALLILMPEESNDKGFAMTSSFSCMALTAMLLFDKDNFHNNKKELELVANKGFDIIKTVETEIETLVKSDYERVVYLGSGPYLGLARESALKLLELTRGQVIGYTESVMGFRHGPKSIVKDNTINFIYLSNNEYSRKYDLDIIKELYSNDGNHRVVVIGNLDCEDIKSNCDYYFNIEEKEIKNDILLGLLYVLYAQVFSLMTSVKTGINPDNPNPSGAVNRVVKGVVIYDYK